jgi:hypothetical protein
LHRALPGFALDIPLGQQRSTAHRAAHAPEEVSKTQGETVKKLSWQRHLTSIILTLSFSCAALGGDGRTAGSGAVMHASGKVQVNGAASREITTLFPGDSIETTEDSVANITSDGSSVLVMPNASVKFMGNDVEFGRGSIDRHPGRDDGECRRFDYFSCGSKTIEV